MVQEVDIKLNIVFLQSQVRDSTLILDEELTKALEVENEGQPIKVTEIISAIKNTHLRLTTGVDASKSKEEIAAEIKQRIKELLPMGTLLIEVLSLREEAEIYNTNSN